MTQPTEWTKLREWNGSQSCAFEELCCQLAHAETVPAGSHFDRKGTPDSGIEAYWTLASGDEWGWQAKFFVGPVGSGQWAQLDKSVRAALDGHSRLTKYTVCMALDLPDARKSDQESLKTKWDDHVTKWTGWAEKRDMRLSFEFWGTHEIFQRLTLDEHVGRNYYWFNAEVLQQKWFESHIRNTLADAGERYTPAAHVQLSVSSCLEALGRTSGFLKRFDEIRLNVAERFSRFGHNAKDVLDRSVIESLQRDVDKLVGAQDSMRNVTRDLPLCELGELCASVRNLINDQTSIIRSTQRDANSKSNGDADDRPGHALDTLNLFASTIDELDFFVGSPETQLANIPVLLLVGDGGAGKTHLFCSVAERRVKAALPTVLILGEKIASSEPWSQITRILGLTCRKPDEFLGSLNAAGEAAGVRALLMIDALNEGEGKKIWNKYLSGMLSAARDYPWIAIALSVRSSYEDLVIPPKLTDSERIRIEHRGFSGHEYDACRAYFDYFGIELPSVPILNPEFSNPLFLKLFCRGLNAAGLTRVPDGFEGITKTFEFFIQAINEKLAGPAELNFDPKQHLVWRSVVAIAKRLKETGKDWLPRAEARDIVDAHLLPHGYDCSLFERLISEGILSEERFVSPSASDSNEIIRFTYDRLKDYLVASHLIESVGATLPPDRWFIDCPGLSAVIRTAQDRWFHAGLIEMLSILIPEKCGRELRELIPQSACGPVVEEAFVASLIWRKSDSFGQGCLELVYKCLESNQSMSATLCALLRVATRPNHPLNADFLHALLFKQPLALRDAFWSTFLHYEYGEQSVIDSFLDWAWRTSSTRDTDDETARLASTSLSWFFTSSNRFLRDRATKALVCLLQHKLYVYERLIDDFLDVNDPYVLERILAAAFGSAARGIDNDQLGKLAALVYNRVFEAGTPPVHILTREYAKAIIELAHHRGCELRLNEEKIRPPYDSAPPQDPPSEEELIRKYDLSSGYVHILRSVLNNMEDFSNYVIDPLFARGPWAGWRLTEKRPLTRFERSEAFCTSLSTSQKEAWTELASVVSHSLSLEIDSRYGHGNNPLLGQSQDDIDKLLYDADLRLRSQLDSLQLTELDEAALRELTHTPEALPWFDIGFAKRWIFTRTVELGWTPQLFKDFDRNLPPDGRSAHKAERIGKKYQWIALHELLARVSDNYFLVPDWSHPRPEPFQGTWQIPRVRDIDPTMCLTESHGQKWVYSRCWWAPEVYDPRQTKDGLVWMKDANDWPSLDELIEVRNPDDKTDWVVLHTFLPWDEPGARPKFGESQRWRKSWVSFEAYLVRDEHMDEVIAWAKKRHFWQRWMPESLDFYNACLGEYPWAQAYQFEHEDGIGSEEWTCGHETGQRRIAQPVLLTNHCFVGGGNTLDCSLDETVSIRVPSPGLIERMSLRWRGEEGKYYDANKTLVALDPSIRQAGPGAFLLARKPLQEFLAESGLSLFWVILGEKMDVSMSGSRDDYNGHLEVSGVGWWQDDKFRWELNPLFRAPEAHKSPQD